MSAFVVGLTGGIGSGKSAAAALFAGHGVPVVDTDGIAHELTAAGSPLLPAIAALFGPECINADGALNRAWLRQRIFADAPARHALEAVLHPEIRAAALQRLQQHAQHPYQMVVVPLLFESGGYHAVIARSVAVDCDEAQQVARAAARGGLSEKDVRAIMATQLGRAPRNALADDVLDNSGTLEDLRRQVAALHEKYLGLARLHDK